MSTGILANRLRRALATLSILPAAAAVAAEIGPDPTALTPVTGGRPLQAVWCRAAESSAGQENGTSSSLLMAFDSRDGTIRQLLPSPGQYFRPLLTPSGNGVVFTELPSGDAASRDPLIRIAGWDGGDVRDLGAGVAVAMHRAPESGADCVIALDSLDDPPGPDLRGSLLVRFRVDSPDTREIIWSASAVSAAGFQLSRDGTRAGGFFPYPQSGVADLTTMSLLPGSHGSGAAFAPDDSYTSLVLDPTRRRMRLLAPNLDPGWEFSVAELPGFHSSTISHPRWSNDPAVVTFSGPPVPQTDGPAPGIFVMRLRNDLRRIESVVRLSSAVREERFPDVRIQGSDGAVSALVQKPAASAPTRPDDWPVASVTPLFAWRNADTRAETPGTTLTPKRYAKPGRNFEMDLSAGWYEAAPEAGTAIATACAGSGGFTLELILTERRSEPPLSVRLVTLRHPDGHDLFALYRVDRRLVARILCGPENAARDYPVVLTSLAIQDDRPVHVAVSLNGSRMSTYIDGQETDRISLEASGLAAWTDGRLFFGDPKPYGNPWTGWLERVAIYPQPVPAQEIGQWARSAATWLESRQRPKRVRVRAVLQGDPRPEPGRESAADALAVTTWKVDQVLTGVLEGTEIRVLHWIRLNGEEVPNPFPQPGNPAEFTIEPPEDHPEVGAARVSAASGDGTQPVWIFTNPPGRPLSNPVP